MGSGIAITKQQVIYIVKRELTETFEHAEMTRERVDSDGYTIPETFEDELSYQMSIRRLNRLLHALSNKGDEFDYEGQ